MDKLLGRSMQVTPSRSWTRFFLFSISLLTGVGLLIAWRVYRRRCREPRKVKQFSISDYDITVVSTAVRCEEYLVNKVPRLPKAIGLDCEWISSSKQHPVALLQLAFPNNQCLLVRLCKIGEVTPTLMKILTDKSILKFGVGICNDSKRLASGFGVPIAGCVDLQHVALRCGVRGEKSSLKTLSKVLLGIDLKKSSRITCSNWEADYLSAEQVQYAASDAIVSLHILKALLDLKLPTNFSDAKNDENDWIIGFYSSVQALCQGIVDVTYKNHQQGNQTQPKTKTSAYSVRKSPLYHNCQLLAPDGSLLSFVDKKKVEWYLQRDLAVLLSESPIKARLKFEPAGSPDESRQYYLVEKENICVVCGKNTECLRKNIVPHEYRKHFPPTMKMHQSHDILLLCVTCHQSTNHYDAAMKQQLAIEYGAPVVSSSQKFIADPWLVQVKSHAKALLRRNQIPEERKRELVNTLTAYLNCSPSQLTEVMIEQCAQIDSRSRVSQYVTHGEVVVSKATEKGELLELQRKWRRHFIKTMKPKFMPQLWSIDHT